MRNTPSEEQSTNNSISRSSSGQEHNTQRNETETRDASSDNREDQSSREMSELQDGIRAVPNRNEQNQSSNDTDRENVTEETETERPTSNAATNLFDGLIDNMLGMIREPSAGNGRAEDEGMSRTPLHLGMASNADFPGRNSEGFGRDIRDNLPPGSNLEGSSGAIIITVNYVFADDNNPENRNRLGALFMTLPNFPSARDPRVIHEFIRLATQMAYSTLINGFSKERGITTETFDSFKIKSSEEVSDTSTCPICFEKYDDCQGKKKSFEKSGVESFSKKRRRLNRSDSSLHSESDRDSAFEVSSAESSNNNSSSNRPKLLSEVPPLEEHYPVEMPCGHLFGASCLFEWLKSHSTCPLCRNRVNSGTNVPEGSENNMNNNNFRVISRTNLADMLNNINANGNNLNERSAFTRILRPDNSGTERTFGEEGSFSSMISNIFPTLESATGQNRERNNDTQNQSENSFSNLLSYLRTSMRRNDDTLFPTGLFSRRTPDGVDTGQVGNRDIFSDLQETFRRGQEPGSNSDRENNE